MQMVYSKSHAVLLGQIRYRQAPSHIPQSRRDNGGRHRSPLQYIFANHQTLNVSTVRTLPIASPVSTSRIPTTLLQWPPTLWGTGGPKLKEELPNLVSMFLAWQVTLYLLASQHGQRSAFWDTLSMFWLILVDDECLKLMRTPQMASDIPCISGSVTVLTKEQNKTADRRF